MVAKVLLTYQIAFSCAIIIKNVTEHENIIKKERV